MFLKTKSRSPISILPTISCGYYTIVEVNFKQLHKACTGNVIKSVSASLYTFKSSSFQVISAGVRTSDFALTNVSLDLQLKHDDVSSFTEMPGSREKAQTKFLRKFA